MNGLKWCVILNVIGILIQEIKNMNCLYFVPNPRQKNYFYYGMNGKGMEPWPEFITVCDPTSEISSYFLSQRHGIALTESIVKLF